jgi:hypothetical protein
MSELKLYENRGSPRYIPRGYILHDETSNEQVLRSNIKEDPTVVEGFPGRPDFTLPFTLSHRWTESKESMWVTTAVLLL